MKSRLWLLVPTLLAAVLGGCASNPNSSYVSDKVRASDASKLAADTVSYLSDELPPARTTLLVQVPENKDVVTSVMLDKLRQRGYGVTIYTPDDNAVNPVGTLFRYYVSPLENGIWLRLTFPGKEVTRSYVRTTSGLLSTTPFIVKEGAARE